MRATDVHYPNNQADRALQRCTFSGSNALVLIKAETSPHK
jgi:hypothetical protein